MNIRLATTEDKQKWNEFVSKNETGSFLQSWEWSEFMATQKDQVWRFVITDDDNWLASIFIFKTTLKINQSILYSPRGPVINDQSTVGKAEIFQLIMQEIDKLAKRGKYLYFQVDPYTNNQEWANVLSEKGFEKSESDIQPRHTLILDIRQTEEGILAGMHQKTRYNINLARKKGIEVEVDNSKFKEFWELLKKTTQRQGITFYSQEYYKELLKIPFVKLYLAKHEGKVIAANIMVFWNDTATYLFGSSDYEHRNLMAPHLLQWQALKDSKDEGLWFYDFWGAAPAGAEGRESKWAGFTKFKMGFSPNAEITEYIGTYEKVYMPIKLGLYRFIRGRFKK